VDVMPTVLEAAGIRVPPKARVVAFENGSIPDLAAPLRGRWHYIETYTALGEPALIEQYDIQVDPGEDANIAASESVERLHKQFTPVAAKLRRNRGGLYLQARTGDAGRRKPPEIID
jgi:hypothetical protein